MRRNQSPRQRANLSNRPSLPSLLVDNRGRGSFRAEGDGDGEAVIYLYDAIVGSELEAEWWGGVTPGAVIEQLKAFKGRHVLLRINSPGGDVFAARAIEQALREHEGGVSAQVDGLAASSASTIAVACDEVRMAPGSFFMIHRASTFAWGNVNDFEATAVLLGKIDKSIAELYAEKAGGKVDAWLEAMDDETWYTAAEAIDAGLADGMVEEEAEEEVANRVKAWNLSAYRHAPGAASQNLVISVDTPGIRDAIDAAVGKMRAELGLAVEPPTSPAGTEEPGSGGETEPSSDENACVYDGDGGAVTDDVQAEHARREMLARLRGV